MKNQIKGKANEMAFGKVLNGLMTKEVAEKLNVLLAEPIIKIKLIHPDAMLPARAHPGDAAEDLFACEAVEIKHGEVVKVRTGITSWIQPNFYVTFESKSGLSANENIHLVTGTIDPNYREEWFVPLLNNSGQTVIIHKHQKIAQMMIKPIMRPKYILLGENDELEPSERNGGFGSSGKFKQ